MCELKFGVSIYADSVDLSRTPCGVCELKSDKIADYAVVQEVAPRVGCVS